jgi:cell wall-associated NlpC family hydrolase
VPRCVLPRRAATIAAGVIILFSLVPAPGQARGLADPVDRQIAAAEEQLEIVIEDYNDTREELRDSLRRADELSAELAELDRELERHRAELGRILARAYRANNSQALVTVAALLDLPSSEGLTESLVLVSRLGREQQRAITELTTTRDRITEARLEARQLSEELRGAERKLSSRKRQIEAEIVRLARMRDAAGDTDSPGGTPDHLPALAPGAAATAVKFAFAQLGKPYQWGGSGPGGYDCSGLTSSAWAAAGVRLPHNAARQWGAVNRISRAERRPGDLIFYYRDIHHVAIYVGDNRIIHAPRPGKRIRLDHFDYQPIHSFGRPG